MPRSPRLLLMLIGGLGFTTSLEARADAPEGPGRGQLTESYCKAKATRSAVTAAMNKQRVTSSRVKFVRFEYLERVRKDEFCAYSAVLANGAEPLFAAFRLPGAQQFKFKHLD